VNREQIDKTLMTTIGAQVRTWDSHNYPSWSTAGEWETAELAHNQIKTGYNGTGKYRIVVVEYRLLNSGRISRVANDVVWEDDSWVKPKYDPRMNDPDYVRYLELRERFEK